MKVCESCQNAVEESLLVEDKYNTYAHGEQKRIVCVMCKQFLPITYFSCYDNSSGTAEYHRRVKSALRHCYGEIAEAVEAYRAAVLEGRVGPLARPRTYTRP